MYRFNISAPGRVFLSGDPTRYNEHCLAASLNMRTKLQFSSIIQPSNQYFIEINFSSITLHMKIPFKEIFAHFINGYFNRVLTDVELHEGIRTFVSSLKEYTGTYVPSNRTHHLSLQAFFFLFVIIVHEKNIKIKSSFVVEVSTELAIGEGLGSSASFAACLAACFYRWSLLQNGIVLYKFDNEHIINVLQYTQRCHWTIYNSSTAVIDSIISVYGSIQMFQEEETVNVFRDIPNIKILLVSSNVSQKTTIEQRKLMNGLRRFYPFIQSIQHSIDEIVNKSTDVFKGIENRIQFFNENVTCETDEDQFHLVSNNNCLQLSLLIQANQGLLRALSMSHPNLDTICAIAKDFSFMGKIAGNGGGGFAFILLLPNSTDELINQLLNKLLSHNFSARLVNLNCSGVRLE